MNTIELNVIGRATKTYTVADPLRIVSTDDMLPGRPVVFRILNQADGDKRIVWDADDYSQIREAKKLFDQLIEDGFVPYLVDPSGERTPEVMASFDPYAEEVVMSDTPRPKREIVMTPQPMLVGG